MFQCFLLLAMQRKDQTRAAATDTTQTQKRSFSSLKQDILLHSVALQKPIYAI